MRLFCCAQNGRVHDHSQLVKTFIKELRHQLAFLNPSVPHSNRDWTSQHCFETHSSIDKLFQPDTRKYWSYRNDQVEENYRVLFDTYITAHLVRQLIAKLFNMHLIKPKFEENLKISFHFYSIHELGSMRYAFWHPFEKAQKKNPADISKVLHDLAIENLKELKIKKMIKKAIADWPEELVSLKIYHVATKNLISDAIELKINKL